ncbi:hypothetical protein RJ641_003945 [Dillenia turbinata]|uniref:Uncharacterized protein n=1 Tax=Dillenia turbinata TaxID=194707 RepID=A0AAN8Z9D4_9MAGN
MYMAKINQGNIALKRNFFEDVKLKILMILCESPDPKELHKPIFTLEYGAKAKGIVHGAQTPVKDKARDESQVWRLSSDSEKSPGMLPDRISDLVPKPSHM